ncbi:hypothetical protein [Microcoleus sp. herbarium5]|uniref:hypothetical protein n=1 Tax=Microcoleus sp. herbarium5 TaxID=3055434 RepID=UPI002FD5ACB2
MFLTINRDIPVKRVFEIVNYWQILAGLPAPCILKESVRRSYRYSGDQAVTQAIDLIIVDRAPRFRLKIYTT